MFTETASPRLPPHFATVVFGASAIIALTALSTPWALALGVALAFLRFAPATESGAAQMSSAVKQLLPLCVIGLGAGMQLDVVLKTGAATVVPTFLSIATCFVVGFFLARRLGVGAELATLLSAGTAICGGSAIAATSDAIGAKASTMTVALSTIFVLNGIALLIFPPLGHALGLTPETFGAFAALAIHDTSSVVGAAAAYDTGGVALEIATATKLARALWIVPVTLALGALVRRRSGTKGGKVARPWFILGFVVLAAICTYVPGADAVGDHIAFGAKRGLSLVLFLVGAQLSPAVVRKMGARAFGFAATLWGVMCVVSLGLVFVFALGTP